MKRILATFLVTSLTLFSAKAQLKHPINEKVKNGHRAFIDAILAEDYMQVDELLAEDVKLGFPSGGFTPKQDYVNALRNGSLFYDSSSNQYSSIRIYGNTGIVNGTGNLVFRYKDKKGEWYKMLEHLSYTAVYVIDKDQVKMVGWQSNRPTTDQVIKVKE